MLPFLCHALDRWVIRSACGSVPHMRGRSPHAEEARAALAAPDYLEPAVEPARIEWQEGGRFTFPSPLPSPWTANNRVPGRFYPLPGEWSRHPAVVMLHGWNGEIGYYHQFPRWAMCLRRRGINVLTLELPYHGIRRPRQAGAPRNFLSSDLFHMVSAVRQSLADLGGAMGWLRAQGVPVVGLWGVSFGGWLTGLGGCTSLDPAAAVMTVPVVRMDRAIAELPFFEPVRQSLAREHVQFETLNLREHRLRMNPTRLLMVAGQYDLFGPVETVEELHALWPGTVLRRFKQGHISMLIWRGILEGTCDWLAQQLHAAQREREGAAPAVERLG